MCRVKPLNAKLNPIRHLLALLGAHHILHVSRIRVYVLALGVRGDVVGWGTALLSRTVASLIPDGSTGVFH